jgi:DNA-binding transcriptional ArsR family regulator
VDRSACSTLPLLSNENTSHLTYSDIGIYIPAMARLSTTTDVFNAIAEPQRRDILALLAKGERSVNEVADSLHMLQPRASKHLRVLREVGLVNVRDAGQQRLYNLNGEGLKPIHDWVSHFENFWSESFDRLDAYLAKLQQKPHRPRVKKPPAGSS